MELGVNRHLGAAHRHRRDARHYAATIAGLGLVVACWGKSDDGRSAMLQPMLEPMLEEEPLGRCRAPVPGYGVTTLQNPELEAIYVSNQEELEELAGCEELNRLTIFGAHDLSPLRSLHTVRGELSIGDTDDTLEPLESFDGLQALRRVGALKLTDLAPSTLRGLEGLVEANRVQIAGMLLEDLAGLAGVQNIRSLNLASNPNLTSLDGIQLPSDFSAGELNFGFNPALTDLGALSHLTSVGTLTITSATLDQLAAFANVASIDYLDISYTELQNLDPLSGLRRVDRLKLTGNRALANADGLRGIQSMQSLSIRGCDSLTHVDLSALELIDSLVVAENGGGFELDLAALRDAENIDIFNNPGLSTVRLPALQRAGDVAIQRNQALSAVALPALSEVSTLLIALNPTLDAQAITRRAELPIELERIGGNAGSVEPSGIALTRRLLDPCPWPADGVCDACETAPSYEVDPDLNMGTQCPRLLCGPMADATDCN